MAFKASGLAGTAKLHDLTSSSSKLVCDLCGDEVDSEVADAVALDCSFAQCDPESSCYHAHCLERFLKSMRCERNRKIGFPCPRGCGKGTKFKEACRGKILKSHPVSIRSEANKKRRQAELEQLAQQTAARDKDKPSRKKDEEPKAAAGKAGKGKEKGKAAAKPAVIKALNVANTAITSAAPPKTQAQLQKEQLAAAAKNLKSQILARSSSTASSASSTTATAAAAAAASSGRLSAAGSAGGKREVKTLDEYMAERTGASSAALDRSSSLSSSAAPAASAWGKSRASSASSLEAPELAEAAAAAAAAAPAAAPPAAPSLSSEEAFPPPAASAAAAGPGKPPRPHGAAAAAAPAPAPAPAPAAAQPQGAWAHKPSVAAAAASAAPPPPPPRPPAAAPAAAGARGRGTAAAVVVAALPVEDGKLSRTQRKNQRRAEKKAAAAAAADAAASSPPDAASASPADSLPTSPQAQGGAASARERSAFAAAEEAAGLDGSGGLAACGEAFERCMQALVQHKLQHQVEQLAAVGFPPSVALAAVQQHGGSLEGALVALIEQATGVQDSMHGLGRAVLAAPAEVDLTEELHLMQELQARYGLPPGAVELLAVEQQGDLASLAASLAQQQQQALLALPFHGGAHARFPAQHQHSSLAAPELPAEPLSPGASTSGLGGGGLFGTLAPSPAGSGQSYSADSWGQSCYSAFGFGGFAEAALSAVRDTAGQACGVGTPTSGDHPSPAGAAGIWGGNPSPLAAAAGGGGGAYGGSDDLQLLSLLGASDAAAPGPSSGGGAAAAASSSGFGLLGSFNALQPSSSSSQPAFHSGPLASATGSASFLPGLPIGSSLLQQQQLPSAGWGSSEGLAQPQQPLSGLPLWSAGGGLGAASGVGAATDNLGLLVR